MVAIFKEMYIPRSKPTSLYCDNKAVFHIVANSVHHERTKHIEMNCHVVREKLQAGVVRTFFVSS